MLWRKKQQSWILGVLGVESELQAMVIMQERDGNSLNWGSSDGAGETCSEPREPQEQHWIYGQTGGGVWTKEELKVTEILT